MINKKLKYDYKYIFSSVVIVAIAIVAYYYWNIIKVIIRIILESEFPSYLLSIIALIVFINYLGYLILATNGYICGIWNTQRI